MIDKSTWNSGRVDNISMMIEVNKNNELTITRTLKTPVKV